MLLSTLRSWIDQPTTRSHPNKAVHVVPANLLDSFWFSHINSWLLPRALTCVLGLVYSWLRWRWAARQPVVALWSLAWHGAVAHIPLRLPRAGCSKIASFRATAALFFAFFPPRSHRRSPYRRKSVSGPNGPKIYWALPTRSLRSIESPALLIPNCGWLSPESSCFGANPK